MEQNVPQSESRPCDNVYKPFHLLVRYDDSIIPRIEDYIKEKD